MIAGLTKNKSVNEKGLIDYVCKVVQEKNLYRREFEVLKNESSDRFHVNNNIKNLIKKNSQEQTFLVQKEPGRAGMIEAYDETRTEQHLAQSKDSNDHMIVNFSIMLLEMALRHHIIRSIGESGTSESLANMLIPKLIKYISGKHVSLALCSLRVLVHLSQLTGKSALKVLLDRRQMILDGVFELISNVSMICLVSL